MEPGWFVLCAALFVQMLFTLLLVAPMPSNAVRGAVTHWVRSLAESQPVKYASWFVFTVNLFYFWYTLDGLPVACRLALDIMIVHFVCCVGAFRRASNPADDGGD